MRDRILGVRIMINACDARLGLHVFYQQPHMRSPEYGAITGPQSIPTYVHVLSFGDGTAKACHPRDLHWPPDYCAADRVNPTGQIYSTPS